MISILDTTKTYSNIIKGFSFGTDNKSVLIKIIILCMDASDVNPVTLGAIQELRFSQAIRSL